MNFILCLAIKFSGLNFIFKRNTNCIQNFLHAILRIAKNA